jgi:hypothetical protein
MKKLFLVIFVFLFASLVNGQAQLYSNSIANAAERTILYSVPNPVAPSRIDSIVFTIHVQDSIDIRSILFQRGKQGRSGYITRSANDSVTTTFNVTSASGSKYAVVRTLKGTELSGVDYIQLIVKGHSSGNAATLNNFRVFTFVYRK